ncbi:MAG: hypothetical protein OXU53_11650 [Deltaproteobacteria bacterium]|nr:hypothetical protein [Deltaproteobacteria bacterium]
MRIIYIECTCGSKVYLEPPDEGKHDCGYDKNTIKGVYVSYARMSNNTVKGIKIRQNGPSGVFCEDADAVYQWLKSIPDLGRPVHKLSGVFMPEPEADNVPSLRMNGEGKFYLALLPFKRSGISAI